MKRLILSLLIAFASSATAFAADKLHLYTWEDYVSPDLVKRFEKENKCEVVIDTFDSNETMFAKLKAGSTGYDLIVPTSYMVKVMNDQGMLLPIDQAQVPNIKNIDPSALTKVYDKKMEHSVPYTLGYAVFAYRTDKVKKAPDSWAVFGEDGVAGGNAFLLEEGRDVVACALLLGGKSVNSVEPADLAAAKAVLRGWKKNVRGFTGETKDHLLSGEAWMIQAYNGDVAQAMKESPGKYGFAVPKEGGILWYDNLVIPKGAPNRDLARKFVEFVLRPDVAARISNGIRYAVPNKDAFEKVDKAVREDPVIYAPAEVRKRLQSELDLGDDMKKVTDLWGEVRAGG